MAKRLRVIYILYLLPFLLAAQLPERQIQLDYIDSLKGMLSITAEDTNKIKLLNRIADEYNTFDFEKAEENGQKALELAQKSDNKKLISTALRRLGNYNFRHAFYDKTVEYYLASLKVADDANDSMCIGYSLNNLGNVFNRMAELNNPDVNRQQALNYFNRALTLRLQRKEYGDANVVMLNMSNVYTGMGQPKKAIEMLQQALDLFTRSNDGNGMDLCRLNISLGYIDLHDIEKNPKYLVTAEDYLSKSLTEIGYENTPRYASALTAMGDIRIRQNRPQEAIEYFLKALNKAKKDKSLEDIKGTYSGLMKAYAAISDHKNALEYHQLYVAIKDSIFNEKSGRQITEMAAKYESEKKEKDIQLLTKDKKLQQSEIGKQKVIRNTFIIGLVLALLLAYFMYNRFQLTRKQKKTIEHQNEQIVESINYSKRIQNALLPSLSNMQQSIPSLLIYYEPKNIVSGDFYFFREFQNYILLACVDCTGHGVPGGFMSTLGNLLLDKIANSELLKPSEILTRLNDEIIQVLHQEEDGILQDGMDLSVCLIDKHNATVQFSGARNGIIVVSGNEARRYKASLLPVGGNYKKKGIPIARNFETHTITLHPTDWLYMYTDGFMEQVGGEAGLPMTYKQFEEHLIRISGKQTTQQKLQYLQTAFDTWRGNNEKTDDVLIVGFRGI